MTINNGFAERLRLLRGERGLSQVELANLAGIAPAQLSRYELGKAHPRSEVLAKLASALGVSVKEISQSELSRGIHVRLPFTLLDRLVESAALRTGKKMVERDDIWEEVRLRLEESFDAPSVRLPSHQEQTRPIGSEEQPSSAFFDHVVETIFEKLHHRFIDALTNEFGEEAEDVRGRLISALQKKMDESGKAKPNEPSASTPEPKSQRKRLARPSGK